MITSAQCRVYAKKSQLLGKTLDVSFKRRSSFGHGAKVEPSGRPDRSR